ncbi:MAG: D-tyrosyl-tRNA(Tyr) deacylase [Acidimicrobiales bacterium]|jgi:D-tyrosyl-tRNA(Tyr) deacylase|nr:D-tyrosyl-tRNA(Tyr) deacylase [Acidimicrobiales bacterium]PZN29993.1 MAG: D-tyrosyl-tRNA(Tyr) deacylase [Actinomycetota bacterium]HLV90499.1 D-aminoacyl-tRNA deacylase [Acidimicrobiia bacterium]
MRVVAQRVSRASVTVDGRVVGEIGPGLLLLAGVARGDTEEVVRAAADKLAGLRIFPDDEGRMNRSVVDLGGSALVVSQFTLLGDARRGRRPSFTEAAPGPEAEPLVELFARELEARGVPTSTGSFGAHMEVELVNDGPVTLVLDF